MKKTLLFVLSVVMSLMAQAQDDGIKVLEYCPAPGQFVNTLPEFAEGDTYNDILQHCENQLNDGLPVHLGAFGGYITLSLDAPIQNGRGSDLRILGNAFYSSSDPVYGSATIGGSVEPGTVWAGIGSSPETAQWYELAGSEYYTTERTGYSITYHRPTAETGNHSQPSSIYDDYIRYEASWTDADGTECDTTGYLMKNAFHTQSYWPQWVTTDKLTFKASRLPNNAINYGGTGIDGDTPQSWVLYRYASDSYGYADAAPNTDNVHTTFDLDWAVDHQGNPAHIDHADFIRIQTAVLQQCGWIGETSTEVCGIENLHHQLGYDDDPIIITPRQRPTAITAITERNAPHETMRFALDGTRISKPRHGINIVRLSDGTVRKEIIR